MVDREEIYRTTLADIESLKTTQLANLNDITTLDEVREAQQGIVDQVTQDVFNAVDDYGKRRYRRE